MNLKPLQLVFLLFSLLGVMCKKEPIKKEEITGLPQINTNAVTITSAGTATSGGRTLSSGDGPITAKGICWGIQENPDFSGNYTINGNGMGDYVSKLEGLSKNTQYYVRAYATNNKGTSFGESVKFAISSKAPELTDLGCQKIKGTSAEIHFSISSNYENATMEIHYGKDTSFSQKKIFNAPSKLGTNFLSSLLSNLEPNTTYHYFLRASNNIGTTTTDHSTFTTTNISIGEKYQGGIIIFLDSTNNHGLIAAERDIVNSSNNSRFNWSLTNSYTNATGQVIGTGKENTALIIANQESMADIAAVRCKYANTNGYKDWYLPSIDELGLIYDCGKLGYIEINNLGIPGDTKSYYWSSTEFDKNQAYVIEFNRSSKSPFPYNKVNQANVRAIRSF